MKKALLFFSAMTLFTLCSFAQITFSDDFESYNVGDYIGSVSPEWTTWSGATGGAEDGVVGDGQAASGTNAVSVQGVGAGGPQDIVLPFGDKYTTGQFTFSINLYVTNGAYFNFQGEEAIGVEWTGNAFFEPDGTLFFTNSDNAIVISTTYELNTWINVAYDVNLTANSWSISVDGECLGAYENPNNSVASADIFPIETDAFWFDDVTFSWTPEANIPQVDLGLSSVNIRVNGIKDEVQNISGEVKNNGTDMITSYDVTVSNGTDNFTESYTGLTLANNQTTTFQIGQGYIFPQGEEDVSVTISNVNGSATADENACNNSNAYVVRGYVPAPGKVVLAEEATGTWCQWCPRGAVFLDLMEERYPTYFAGVAVHNGDPMAVQEHDSGITSIPGFTGFPSVAMEREDVIDPSQIEGALLSRLEETPIAVLQNGATYDSSTGELIVSVTATFNEAATGDYRLNVIITEDGLTGTSSDWAQSNAYAGGNAGPMGGYENLPSPVPASQMVYDHVSRGLLAGYQGSEESLPANMEAGSTYNYTFSMTVPSAFDVANIHLIGVLLAPNGTAANASKTTIAEAVNNGLVNTDDLISSNAIKTFPNPFSTELNVQLDLEDAADVQLYLYSINGALVQSQKVGQVSGNQTVTINTTDLAAGVYHLNIVVGNQAIVKKVVLTK